MHRLLSLIRRRHTAVAAYLALFSALGGSAYAALQVTSQDIVDSTIQTQDIASGAVGSSDIARDSIVPAHIPDNSIGTTEISKVQSADIGLKAVKADHLDVKLATVVVDAHSLQSLGTRTATATCPPKYQAISGGGQIEGRDPYTSPIGRTTVTASVPLADGTGWHVAADPIYFPPSLEFELHRNDDGVFDGYSKWVDVPNVYNDPWGVRAYVVCARLQ